MWDMILKGGPIMWPLLLASVIALAIFFEKLYSLQINKILPSDFFEKVLELVKEGKNSEAKAICEMESSPISKICLAGISNHGHNREVLKSCFEEVGKKEEQKLSSFIGVIGTIASVSPLLGLLGTVLGMIKVFQVISTEGVGNAASLSGGISEALLTTAAGLTVAIPALIMYRFCRAKVNAVVALLEERAVLLLDALSAKGN